MMSESNQPLVSILIPTYNREDLIGESIQSALNQTYQNIEVIITDNCSTDKTPEIVKSYQEKDSRIKFLQNEKNLGPVLNWERCLDAASGEYSKILWSDDLIRPEFIESCLELFVEESDLAFVFTRVKIGQDSFQGSSCYNYFKRTGIFDSKNFIDGIIRDKELPVSPGCAIFKTEILRKSFIKTNEMFENKYLQNGAGPDLLMFLMSCSINKKFGYVNSDLSFFRDHTSSISIIAGQNLAIFYKKAVVWFIYHKINQNFANAYFLNITKTLLGKKNNVSESFDLRKDYVRKNPIVWFYYSKMLFNRLFRVVVKTLCCLIPIKSLRHKIRKNIL